MVVGVLCLALTSNAQQSVQGQVTCPKNDPIPYATVLLLAAKDSSLIKGAITSESGSYSFEKIETGSYLISAGMVGYETVLTQPFHIVKDQTYTQPSIILPEGLTLNEVVVKEKKVLFELKQDRVVMNVSASPSFSGNTGLELLSKTPGVILDRQNRSISMTAKGEVLVMINDRVQRMPMDALMARLEGMRAENIEQIEIIHQPPAKYDASGTAGIIHIVLKQNNMEGTNASASIIAGYGQREKAGFNLNLNSRRGKINWYGGGKFNYSKYKKFQVNHFREYEYQGHDYSHESYVTFRNHKQVPHAANLGLDMNLTNQTILGVLLTGTKNHIQWGRNAESTSVDFIDDTIIRQQSIYINPSTDVKSISGNLNLLQKISSKSDLNFNLDYSKIQYDNFSDLQFDDSPAAQFKRKTLIDYWIVGLDNTNELGKDLKLETGIKGTFNNTMITAASENFDISPTLFSGKDAIEERILAGYVSLSKKFTTKLNGEFGLRYEHYFYDLNSETGEDVTKVFKNPFPIVRLNYDIDSINTLQFAFNRSIVRPPFFSLTSVLVVFDSSSTFYSNPRLRPTFASTYKVSYGHKSILFSLAYIRRTGQIYNYNTVNKPLHLQTSVPTNLDLENIIEVSLIFPLSPAKWWEMNSTITGYYHKVKDESTHPITYENKIFTYSIQMNHAFRLGNKWTASMDGRYQSHFLLGDQEQYLHPYLNFGIKKEFAKGNSLGIVFQDITNTSVKIDWEYHQPELDVRTYGLTDLSERQVRVTYTHLFGNKKLTDKRQRMTGAQELKDRM